MKPNIRRAQSKRETRGKGQKRDRETDLEAVFDDYKKTKIDEKKIVINIMKDKTEEQEETAQQDVQNPLPPIDLYEELDEQHDAMYHHVKPATLNCFLCEVCPDEKTKHVSTEPIPFMDPTLIEHVEPQQMNNMDNMGDLFGGDFLAQTALEEMQTIDLHVDGMIQNDHTNHSELLLHPGVETDSVKMDEPMNTSLTEIVSKELKTSSVGDAELETIPDIINKLQVSLLIKLYATHFTLEVPESADTPVSLMYNIETKRFLKAVTDCRLMPEFLSEISTLPNLKFYDGSIVVQVQDHQFATPPSQMTPSLKKRNKKKKKNVSPPASPTASMDAQLLDGNSNASFEPTSTIENLMEEEAIGEKVLMKGDKDALFADLNRFIDHYFPELDRECSSLTEEEQTMLRLQVLQRVTVCLPFSESNTI
jgi:hypothetical protein